MLLLLPLGAGLLCLLLLWLLQATRPMPSVPEVPPPIYLLPRRSEEIQSISLAADAQTPYTLIRTPEGGFALSGQEAVPLRTSLTSDMESSLHHLEAAQLAGDIHPGDDLSPFGLSPALLTAHITYQDGEAITLLIGADAPTDEPQRYCMIQGSQTLYTLFTQVADPLFYEADYLRDFSQPQLDASLLDRITLSGQLDFSLFYTPSGWQMDRPYSYPLSPQQTDKLLARIEAMAFESCLGSPEEVDLAALGLDEPLLTVYLDQAATHLTGETIDGEMISLDMPPCRYTLHLGHETGKSGVYLQWEGMIYKASNFLLGFWKELQIQSFLLANPVNLYVNDLHTLALETPSLSRAYSIQMVESLTENNQLARDEYGNLLYDAMITRQGENAPMDAEAFLSWYISLSQMVPSGQLPDGYQPEGQPLARLTLATPSITREISLYPYDPLYDAMEVDGICLYYVENSWRQLLCQAP